MGSEFLGGAGLAVAGSAFFVKRTPVRRVLPVVGASSGAGF